MTMEFYLNWEVENRNNFDMNIEEFIYDFEVNSNQWASGRMEKPITVKANGKTAISIAVTISAASMVRELVDIINRGTSISYICTGNMSLTGSIPGLDRVEFPLSLQGNTRIR